MAFRQTVLREIGGFDPLFGPGRLLAGEDCDAAGRASAMGWSGEYRPEVLVRHHHGRKASDKPRARRSYAIGRGAYHMKLLLSGEFACFAQSVYEIPRSRLRCGTFLWEQLGAMKYTYLILARYFQNRFGRSLSREI